MSGGIRTPDFVVPNHAPYQLDHTHVVDVPPGLEPGQTDSKSVVLTITQWNNVAGIVGHDPTTCGLTVRCSTN